MTDSLIQIDTDGTFVVAGTVRVATQDEAEAFLETGVWGASQWMALQLAGNIACAVEENFGRVPAEYHQTFAFVRT